jgi:Ser/Thr protein kinase RdoA (MazF antagonist)
MTPASWNELANRFNLGAVTGIPRYVARGAMGEIWRLETRQGCWAVKWQFEPDPDLRPADLTVQLTAAAAGIPLPLPVMTRAGDAIARLRDRSARVYAWADLGPRLKPPVSPARAAEAGRLLGTLHGLRIGGDEPVDPWYTAAPDQAHWDDLAARAASTGQPWAAGLAAARGLIAELTAQLVPVDGHPQIACHRDFNPDNVIPAAPDGPLVVLDWECAGPLPAVCEVGYALFAWSCGAGQIDVAAADALLSGYAQASGTDPDLGPGLFTTAIAAHLNYLASMAAMAISDPNHAEYATGEVRGLLAGDLRNLARFVMQSPGLA